MKEYKLTLVMGTCVGGFDRTRFFERETDEEAQAFAGCFLALRQFTGAKYALERLSDGVLLEPIYKPCMIKRHAYVVPENKRRYFREMFGISPYMITLEPCLDEIAYNCDMYYTKTAVKTKKLTTDKVAEVLSILGHNARNPTEVHGEVFK